MKHEFFFKDFQNLLPGKLAGRSTDSVISSLSLDSRKSWPGEGAVFFSIKGPNHDGHQFIGDAYRKGWRLFVVSTLPPDVASLSEASFFVTPDPVMALQKLAGHRRASFDVPVVGITGSNGKTIVKEWLFQLLAPSFRTVKSPKSYNSQIGVPLSVWGLEPFHQLAVFEAGISQPGEMQHLQQVIQPTMGVLTNLGSAHDANFESSAQKLDEKLRLFAGCRKLIYCSDHDTIRQRLTAGVLPGVELVGWGHSRGQRYQVETKGARLKVTGSGLVLEVTLPFEDEKSVENICHAIVAALELGVPEAQLSNQLRSFRPVPMRLSLKAGVWGSTLIDDSYNNDLQGLEAALDFSQAHRHGKELVVIVSDIEQAGPDHNDTYRRLFEILKSKKVSRLIAVGQQLAAYPAPASPPVQSFADTAAFLKLFDSRQLTGKVVLVKGARNFGFERIVEKLQAKVHRTVLEIDLEALQHNFNFYRAQLDRGTKTMVMLKAFAYGGGGGEIGRTLQYLQADYVAVAYPDEGVALRQLGIHLPVMVMNAPEESFDTLAEFQLEPELYSLAQLTSYVTWSAGHHHVPPVHIKLDTGMHRLGFSEDELKPLADLLKQTTHVRVASIFSHLVASESAAHDAFTHTQATRFISYCETIERAIGARPLRHLVNTAGITRFAQYHFDMVRIGIGLHGIASTAEEAGRLIPVGTLRTVVSQVRKLQPGETVGYGRAGKITKPTEVATIAIGYADGYKMAFGLGKGKVLINGQLAPTIGNVCMDMTMIDITGLQVREGDEVIVFGNQPGVKELAGWASTIPYEILTSISDRVKREYHSY